MPPLLLRITKLPRTKLPLTLQGNQLVARRRRRTRRKKMQTAHRSRLVRMT
jgi:hypothetical protein